MLLEIENLTKVYRRTVRANDGISLRVDAGQVVGLLGHNGAGKTTLINQVVGLAKPTSGTIRLAGFDPVADPDLARRTCSLQPQAQVRLQGTTVRQAIELMARIRGASARRARQRTGELLAALELEEWADTVAERVSGGVQRLTGFCMAAAEPGRVVMLDEPTNDVDPVRRRLLWAQVQELGRAGSAVVLVTHNVAEAERAVGRLAILAQGRVVAEGTPHQLRGAHGDRLRLELVAVDEPTAELLCGQVPVAGPAELAGRRVAVPIDPAAVAEVLGWAQRERDTGRVEEFSVTPVSLEDVYIRLSQAESGEVPDAPVAA